MLEIFGISGGILATICIIPYIRDILLGKTRPERAMWLIWTVLGGIAFFSQLAKGATSSLWMTGLETLGQLIVLILALRAGTGRFHRRDYIALFAATLGLILWFFTKEAAVALYIVIGIDFSGTVLTIQKAYLEPETETLSTWVLATMGAILTILSVGKLDIILLSYPVFIFAMNGIIALAIVVGKRSISSSRR